MGRVTVFLAWSPAAFDEAVLGASPGPWREVRRVEDHLLLVDSTESLSQVYHHLTWSFEDGVPVLLVVEVDALKAKGLPPGTQTWVTSRLSPAS